MNSTLRRHPRRAALVTAFALFTTFASTASAQYHEPATASYPLGTPPRELAIRWPAAPRIARTVNATTLAAANAAAARAGTRVRISGALNGTVEVRASDVELVFAPRATASAIWIAKSISRVAVRGGTVDHVELELPATWDGQLSFREELMTTDVLLDSIVADADDTAFLLRAGKRIALTNSTGRAGRYNVWLGDSGDFESEDIIIAGNDFRSAGPEATVRLVHVVRSATVDNRIENSAKHNYRVHGRSDLNWASGNVLVNSGVMLGTMAGDAIRRQWFDDNTLYHTRPSLLEINVTESPSVVMRRNTIYTDVWTCLLCRETPPGWVMQSNRMLPYRQPPAR